LIYDDVSEGESTSIGFRSSFGRWNRRVITMEGWAPTNDPVRSPFRQHFLYSHGDAAIGGEASARATDI
jgi:hypothetical protein